MGELFQREKTQNDFPIEETYLAANGRKVVFHITAQETPVGFHVTAEETKKSRGKRFGYKFEAHSPIALHYALGEIRDKVRRRLSTKYVERIDNPLCLTHDELIGIIDYSREDEETVIQVDGDKITFEELGQILSGYEGFEIEIKIREQ